MKKYLEAGELIEELDEARFGWQGINADRADELASVIQLIEETPGADVVEVVRCRDCKFMCRSEYNLPVCGLHTETDIFVNQGHYCSRGRRK